MSAPIPHANGAPSQTAAAAAAAAAMHAVGPNYASAYDVSVTLMDGSDASEVAKNHRGEKMLKKHETLVVHLPAVLGSLEGVSVEAVIRRVSGANYCNRRWWVAESVEVNCVRVPGMREFHIQLNYKDTTRKGNPKRWIPILRQSKHAFSDNSDMYRLELQVKRHGSCVGGVVYHEFRVTGKARVRAARASDEDEDDDDDNPTLHGSPTSSSSMSSSSSASSAKRKDATGRKGRKAKAKQRRVRDAEHVNQQRGSLMNMGHQMSSLLPAVADSMRRAHPEPGMGFQFEQAIPSPQSQALLSAYPEDESVPAINAYAAALEQLTEEVMQNPELIADLEPGLLPQMDAIFHSIYGHFDNDGYRGGASHSAEQRFEAFTAAHRLALKLFFLIDQVNRATTNLASLP